MSTERIKFGNHDYEITKLHIFNMQVCSNCPPEKINEIENAVRLHSPAGTSDNWYVEKEGDLAPVKCENGSRWHYIFSC